MSNANIVSGLSAYVEEQRYPLLRKAILEGGSISKMVPQLGIKTKAKINYINTDADFQDGSSCGFSPSGTTEYTQREIETGIIKEELEWCFKVLWGKYLENQYRVQADPQAMPFQEEITNDLVAKINKKLEKAVWQGDKTSADANLNKFDGLLTILASESASTVNVTGTTSSSTAYDVIKAVIMQAPEELLDKDMVVLVSPEVYREFAMELVDKNLYHYDPQNGAVTDAGFLFPGTNIRVEKVLGLAGSKKVIGTYWKNLFYGADLLGEEERFRLWYDEKDEMFRFRALWNSGVQVAFPDEVVIAEAN
jgi:hypothetical protein